MSGKEHKLCLRLCEDKPDQKEAWTKIKRSPKGVQRFLLDAVLAYEGEALSADLIADKVIERLNERGMIVQAQDVQDKQDTHGTDDSCEETEPSHEEEITVNENVFSFLDQI